MHSAILSLRSCCSQGSSFGGGGGGGGGGQWGHADGGLSFVTSSISKQRLLPGSSGFTAQRNRGSSRAFLGPVISGFFTLSIQRQGIALRVFTTGSGSTGGLEDFFGSGDFFSDEHFFFFTGIGQRSVKIE